MKIPSSLNSASSQLSPPPSSLEISIMEGKPSPHLKKVLKSYQLTAANTLSGPNSVLSRFEHNSPNSTANSASNSAVTIISSSLAASHGSLIGQTPHYGLKIEKCVKGLSHGELQNTCSISLSNVTSESDAPMKLATALNKPRMENGSSNQAASPGSQDRDRDKMVHKKDATNPAISSSVICIERAIKSEPEEVIIQSGKVHNIYEDQEVAEEAAVAPPNQTKKLNGDRSSSTTSFSSSSDSGSESSCSPVNAATSPVATINVSVMNPLAPSPVPGQMNVGSYPIRKDRLREHTPEEMMAATALAFVKELPPEGLHVTREVIHIGPPPSPSGSLSAPVVVGVKGHHSLHRPSSASSEIRTSTTPPSPPTPGVPSVMYQPQPPPILSTPDRSRSEKLETLLEGEYISCFVVGGEKRLCFPQILTSVLRPFTLPQINQVCDELQIFCSRCSSDQLEVLKVTGVIPMNAHSCGLITKTDAERLVNSLLHRNPPKPLVGSLALAKARDGRTASNFRVYHECFGKCKGIVMPQMYDKPDALCVECVECHGLFSPSRFVAHSHKRQENRTCHWGFDSANWRHYLLLSRDQEERERWEKALDDFKGKFEHKRKESTDDATKDFEDHVVIKKVRYSSPTPMTSPTSASLFETTACLPTKKRLPFIQYSDNDQSTITGYEIESVRKLVLSRMGPEGGAETVTRLLDKMVHRISSLEQICKTQEKTIKDITETKCGAELQAKVNTMEAELHSLKKQLLRRHGQREEI